MRLLIGVLLFASGAGCQAIHGQREVVMVSPPGAVTAAPTASIACNDNQCTHHLPADKCDICCKKNAKDREAPRDIPSPETPKNREAIVTQDVMLIPRMVYVPYAPQTPVTPARLGSLMPAGRALEMPAENREVPPPPAPKPRAIDDDKKLCDAIDKCASMIMKMEERMCELEKRYQGPPPGVCDLPPTIVEMPVQVPNGPVLSPPHPGMNFLKPCLPCIGPLTDKP